MITIMMAQKPASVSIKPPDVDQTRQLPSQQQKAGSSSNASGTTSSVGAARTAAIAAAAAAAAPEQLKCPRCESLNTKFCYYNNYSLSQPRYFCKNCRRYWTKGGSLRNVPVGGGCRKNKRVVHKQQQQQPSQLDPSSSLMTGDHGISLGSLLPPVGSHLSSLLPRFPGGAVTSNSSPYGLTFSRLQESLIRSGSDAYQQPGMNPNCSTPSLLLHNSQPRIHSYSSLEEQQAAASLGYPHNSVNAQTECHHVDPNRLRHLFDTGEHDSMQFPGYEHRHGSSSDSQRVSNGSAAHDLKQQLYHPKSAMQLLQEQQQLATGNSQCMQLPGFEQQAGGSVFTDNLGQNTPGNNFWVINNNQNQGWPEFYPFSSSTGGPPN